MTGKDDLQKCSGCRSTKLLKYFDKNKKGNYYKTCNKCRLRKRKEEKKKIVLDDTNSFLGVIEDEDGVCWGTYRIHPDIDINEYDTIIL